MTVFVTGASGHIGSNLIRELIKANRPVRAFIRNDTHGVEGLEIETAKGDILEHSSLKEAMTGCKTVFHLAACISILGDKSGIVRKTNVTGTQNIVKACLECGIQRLIHFSSIHAYNPFPLEKPVDETHPPPDSRSPSYDRSKADGSQIVLDAVKKDGLNAIIIAPTAVIGPYDFKPSRMGEVLLKLHNRSFVALISGGYNWVDARDVVKGALKAEKTAETGSQFILSGHRCSIRELAELVEKERGIKPPWLTTPMWLARMAAPFSEIIARLQKRNPLFTTEAMVALRRHRLISREKAEATLDYRPRPLEETIKDTYTWFEEQGMLD
jgi:dihydroflavonol-4-reductase